MNRVIGVSLLVFASQAFPCGVCIDDKVASSYDHAVVMQAKQRGHEVAFFAIEGPLVRSAETRGAVLRAIRSASGVQGASARVSLENAALSFAYDPARTTHAAVGAALDARLAERRLSLRFLRVMP
ncbi:MAG: hypothetical protein K0R40_2178 [Burkholderiales bacterium]|jgi:hypothetical protein|nr:hypothetical protein [Burkholderiales bacterium]